MLMRFMWAAAIVAILAGFAAAADQASAGAIDPTPPDVCEYKSRDWSAMRETLVAVARFRGKNDANVQKIAREALGGSRKFSIGEFELQYARGRSRLPPPNGAVCFPKTATFSATRNDGDDAAYDCVATMDVKGTVLAISCALVAG
jgi:hypothetical protein